MRELLFNHRAKETLANLSAGGRLPHALLIEGPAGTGKRRAADLFARYALCCEKNPFCGHCSDCIKIEKRIHPDVCYYTVPEGKREFPIDLVRELRQDAYIAPNEGSCKVYLIDKAHMMNAAAQNALLKMIEEPPSHVRFVLLCENRSMLLPTILSRVTAIALEVPSVAQCEQALEKFCPEKDPQMRKAAAAGAAGNVGRALALLDTAKPSKAQADARQLREMLLSARRYSALKILSSYDKDRGGLLLMLPLLREHFSQLALAHYRGTDEDAALCNRFTVLQALGAAQAVETAILRAEHNVGISLLSAAMIEQVLFALTC